MRILINLNITYTHIINYLYLFYIWADFFHVRFSFNHVNHLTIYIIYQLYLKFKTKIKFLSDITEIFHDFRFLSVISDKIPEIANFVSYK